MRVLLPALFALASAAQAQSSGAYDELRFRLGAVDNTSIGGIGDSWSAKKGGTFEIATPLSVGEVGLGVSHVAYVSSTGKPPYGATIFSLSWVSPEISRSVLRASGGVRLSDYRMDFNDPAAPTGLRTEEEVMPGIFARGRIVITPRWSLVAEGSYGLLMLAHHTPMTFLTAGAQATVGTPGWLRDFLR